MPVFLAIDEILAIHRDQIDRYGGSPGVRDMGLLQSAVAMPASTFDNEFLHALIILNQQVACERVDRKRDHEGHSRHGVTCIWR